jgi:hypothetical protein
MVTLRYERETKIEQHVWRDARSMLGVESIKIGKQGWPDRLFLIPGGRPLLIEFKRGGEEARILQAHRIETLKKLGYDAYAVDNYEDAMAYIRTALRMYNNG